MSKSASKLTGFDNVFAQRLRDLMSDRAVTQATLAEKAGCSRQSISQYMDGTSMPNVDKLLNIAEYFEVSTDYLLGLSNTPTTDKDLAAAADYLGLTKGAALSLKSANSLTQNKALKTLSFVLDQALNTDFLTSLCIDVNLYCTNIMMYADIIMQKADNESKEEGLKRIEDATPYEQAYEAALYRVQKRSVDFCESCANTYLTNKVGGTNGNDQKA